MVSDAVWGVFGAFMQVLLINVGSGAFLVLQRRLGPYHAVIPLHHLACHCVKIPEVARAELTAMYTGLLQGNVPQR